MISLTALYPKTADSHFDMDYYLHTHTFLVRERLTPIGVVSIDLAAGLAGGVSDSLPACAMIGRLNFASLDELQNALSAHGPELIGDIPKFTDVQPLMQISQSV